MIHLTKEQHDDLLAAKAERDRLQELVNSPEVADFLRGVHLEAVHQVERWGTAHDRAKRPADWFWLVGYLAGKALHAAVAADVDKARHHCISTAAALHQPDVRCDGVATQMRSRWQGRRAAQELDKARSSRLLLLIPGVMCVGQQLTACKKCGKVWRVWP